jgi:hypothetical protein
MLLSRNQFQDGDWWCHLRWAAVLVSERNLLLVWVCPQTTTKIWGWLSQPFLSYWAKNNLTMVTGGAIQDEQQCGLVKGTSHSLSEIHHNNMGLIGLRIKLLSRNQFQDGDRWRHPGWAAVLVSKRNLPLLSASHHKNMVWAFLSYWGETNFKMVTGGAIWCMHILYGPWPTKEEGDHKYNLPKLLRGNQFPDGDWWRHLGWVAVHAHIIWSLTTEGGRGP